MLNLYNGAQKKDEMEMRKVYSSKLAELMEKHNEIIALEADVYRREISVCTHFYSICK